MTETNSVKRWSRDFQRGRSLILRYGFAVICVAIALGLALAAQRYGIRNIAMPVLTIAIALPTWYVGIGPSLLAVLLCTVLFDYFFVEPLYSLEVSPEYIPYFLVFFAWAAVVAFFARLRRRIEDDLRQTRDHLQVELEERKRREDDVRRLNEELSKRAAALEASNKELESFAYSVSHDLRAPLRHAAGYAELLQKHASASLDEKARRYMQTIIEASKRMGDLIDDLLAFSRIGRAEAKMSPVDLNQLVREVVAEASREASGRDIVWKIGALPICFGDRSMLKQVLVNLISNAVKFTRLRTRAEIEIGCVNAKPDEEEVFVKDNGAGFDMQYADKLFGVFQRLHRTE
jgi:K+-sensing histidine kinase KdpD